LPLAIGLRDTILGVVIPYLAAGYPIFLLRQAFAVVPTEIWEAARLDGAGEIRTLFTIIMPACRPQVTTATIWSALAAWNGFFWPLLITDTAAARTIQVGLSQLASSEASNPSVIFAGAVLVVIPTMILVIAAQRFLINNLARRALR
jgi:multiple sugar transport system permease protein/sn-glycerol 3-phosphate transport system permease protein